MKKKGILVTGANGWIGDHLCRWLQSKGYFVLACSRKKKSGNCDDFIKIDLSKDPNDSLFTFKKIISSLSDWSFVHCAGHAHRSIETVEETKIFYAVNDQGTRKMVALCQELGIKRMVYVSSIAFYDWSAYPYNFPLDEGAKVLSASAYSDSKLKGEVHVQKSGLDYRIVRLATVFGQGDKANFAKLAKRLKKRHFFIPGSGENQKSVISVNRAAECIGQLALMQNPKYRLVNLGFRSAPSLGDICQTFTKECKFSKPHQIPVPLGRLLGYTGDLITKINQNFPLNTNNIKKLIQSTHVDFSKATEIF